MGGHKKRGWPALLFFSEVRAAGKLQGNGKRGKNWPAIKPTTGKKAIPAMAKLERIAPNAAFAMQLPESGVLLWPATYQKPSNSPLGLLAFRTHEGWLVPGQGSVGVVLGNPRAAEACQEAG